MSYAANEGIGMTPAHPIDIEIVDSFGGNVAAQHDSHVRAVARSRRVTWDPKKPLVPITSFLITRRAHILAP
jgi:hypothetical protein